MCDMWYVYDMCVICMSLYVCACVHGIYCMMNRCGLYMILWYVYVQVLRFLCGVCVYNVSMHMWYECDVYGMHVCM